MYCDSITAIERTTHMTFRTQVYQTWMHLKFARYSFSDIPKITVRRVKRSAKVLSSWLASSVHWCMGSFLPGFGALHFPTLNGMRFPTVQLISPVCQGPSGW